MYRVGGVYPTHALARNSTEDTKNSGYVSGKSEALGIGPERRASSYLSLSMLSFSYSDILLASGVDIPLTQWTRHE